MMFPFVFSLMPVVSRLVSGDAHSIIEFDVFYSLFTLGFLAIVLFESFVKRRLQMLAYLSIVCILVTLSAEVLKLTGTNLNMLLLSAIFKTSLIMIFFALAMSWVKELAEKFNKAIAEVEGNKILFFITNGRSSRFIVVTVK